jgi:hypothetical protein
MRLAYPQADLLREQSQPRLDDLKCRYLDGELFVAQNDSDTKSYAGN